MFAYFRGKKAELGYPEDQFALIIIGTFKCQDKEKIKSLCQDKNCGLVILPHNLTNKFERLDMIINQKPKKFVSS